MLDFLNETTYSNDSLANGDFLSTIGSMISDHDSEPGEGLLEEIDNDLLEVIGDEPEQEEQPSEVVDEIDEEEQPEEDHKIDPAIMAYLFDREPEGEGAPNIINTRNAVGSLGNIPTGLDWLKTKTKNVNISNLNPSISKYLNTLPERIKRSFVATSGNDDKHTKRSKHYSNDALDLRYDDEAYDYMMSDPLFKKMGLKMLPPDHGTAKHLHIESRQFGGAIASTMQQKYTGLNNPSHSEMFFPMKGANTFRGLDNNQPVLVTDGSKYKVLKGKQDTATFNGNVYEKRL